MSNFEDYQAISNEDHDAFFTSLAFKDFTAVEGSDLVSHQFEENFAIAYVDHDEENRKLVIDYYRNYLTELFLKVENRASELVAGISISDGLFGRVIDKACELTSKAISGHPDYVDYLLQKEPEPPEEMGSTFITIRTLIILVKGDETSLDDKVNRVLGLVDAEIWQRKKEDPALCDRVKFIEESKFN